MRADKFFTERFGSRAKAAEALKEGLVLRDGRPLSPADEVRAEDGFLFLTRREEFVSNGGYKLARGLDVFGQAVAGLTFADLGASTGGFTDCLLQRGAKRVFCVDVGESQLATSISADSRVTVMDRTNARYLKAADFPCPLDGVTGDLSFISLRLILPAVKELLPAGGNAFLLFKPQFECAQNGLSKKGICSPALHKKLLGEFYDFCLSLPLFPAGIANAPVRPKKNIEYLVWLKRDAPALPRDEFLSMISVIK